MKRFLPFSTPFPGTTRGSRMPMFTALTLTWVSLSLVTASPATATPNATPPNGTSSSKPAVPAAVASHDPVLLFFTMDGCAPCKQAEPFMRHLAAQGYPVRQIDGPKNPELAQHFGVRNYPTFLMVVDGTVIDRVQESGGDPVILKPRIEKMFDMARKHLASQTATPSRTPGTFRQNLNPAHPAQTTESTSPQSSQSLQTFQSHHNPQYLNPHQTPQTTATSSIQTISSSPEQSVTRCSSSVRLRVVDAKGHSWGTGTIIDAKGGWALILTCGHIFREAREDGEIEVHLFGGNSETKVPGRRIFVDTDIDLALVVIAPPCPVAVSPVLNERQELLVGMQARSVGCNSGSTPTVHEHQILSTDKVSNPADTFHYIQVSGAPVGGRSGGGLFNSEGMLIGVCVAAYPETDKGLFMPPHVIRKVLDHKNLSEVHRNPSLHDPTLEQRYAAAQPHPATASQFDTAPHSVAPQSGTTAFDHTSADAVPLPAPSLPESPVDEPAPPTEIVDSAQAQPAMGALERTLIEHRLSMDSNERTALDEINRRRQDGDEVIVIFFSRRDPSTPSDIIRLDGVSEQFQNELAKAPPIKAAVPESHGDTKTGPQPVSFPVSWE